MPDLRRLSYFRGAAVRGLPVVLKYLIPDCDRVGQMGHGSVTQDPWPN